MSKDFTDFLKIMVCAIAEGKIVIDEELSLLDWAVQFAIIKLHELGKTSFTDDDICKAVPQYCGNAFQLKNGMALAEKITGSEIIVLLAMTEAE